jgi:hypothetical protein
MENNYSFVEIYFHHENIASLSGFRVLQEIPEARDGIQRKVLADLGIPEKSAILNSPDNKWPESFVSFYTNNPCKQGASVGHGMVKPQNIVKPSILLRASTIASNNRLEMAPYNSMQTNISRLPIQEVAYEAHCTLDNSGIKVFETTIVNKAVSLSLWALVGSVVLGLLLLGARKISKQKYIR